jgi:CubicO group peptidase (beta-lactamase class C family)
MLNNPAGTPNDPGGSTMNEIQSGIWITARELARYGLLYLARGNWNGVQILDPSFVEQAGSNLIPASTPPAASFDLTGRYGLYWWTNGVREDGTRPWPSAPEDAYTASGAGGNYLFVIPEWGMAIVRMASHRIEGSLSHGTDQTWEGFFSLLRGGIGPVPR